MTEPSIAEFLRLASQQLKVRSDSPVLDAQILLAHALGQTRTYLVTWPERQLNQENLQRAEQLIAHRIQGHPVAYLTGKREFWSLSLDVNPNVLIPRSDTETLVERALQLIDSIHNPTIIDLGTGSGAIALALASERSDARVIATDRSTEALQTARHNARKLQLPNVEFRSGSWFNAITDSHSVELIVSNPPYIAEQDPHLQQGDLRFEPHAALAAGVNGMADLLHLIEHAPQHLKPRGWLLLEHGHDQGSDTTDALKQRGFSAVNCRADSAGQDRISEGQWR